ncbi:hypothetical protein B0H13DRAFT_1900692 [Mycena leptocephala]|nr:hypothetical protein B0H13DRAFT_1900692 [Mycena leptocephala]
MACALKNVRSVPKERRWRMNRAAALGSHLHFVSDLEHQRQLELHPLGVHVRKSGVCEREAISKAMWDTNGAVRDLPVISQSNSTGDNSQVALSTRANALVIGHKATNAPYEERKNKLSVKQMKEEKKGDSPSSSKNGDMSGCAAPLSSTLRETFPRLSRRDDAFFFPLDLRWTDKGHHPTQNSTPARGRRYQAQLTSPCRTRGTGWWRRWRGGSELGDGEAPEQGRAEENHGQERGLRPRTGHSAKKNVAAQHVKARLEFGHGPLAFLDAAIEVCARHQKEERLAGVPLPAGLRVAGVEEDRIVRVGREGVERLDEAIPILKGDEDEQDGVVERNKVANCLPKREKPLPGARKGNPSREKYSTVRKPSGSLASTLLYSLPISPHLGCRIVHPRDPVRYLRPGSWTEERLRRKTRHQNGEDQIRLEREGTADAFGRARGRGAGHSAGLEDSAAFDTAEPLLLERCAFLGGERDLLIDSMASTGRFGLRVFGDFAGRESRRSAGCTRSRQTPIRLQTRRRKPTNRSTRERTASCQRKKKRTERAFSLKEHRLDEMEVVARPSLVRGRSRIRDLVPDISEYKAKESAKESGDEDREEAGRKRELSEKGMATRRGGMTHRSRRSVEPPERRRNGRRKTMGEAQKNFELTLFGMMDENIQA